MGYFRAVAAVAALCAVAVSAPLHADTSEADSAKTEVSRTMTQEHRLLRAANDALTDILRPRPRDEDAEVTVASRNGDPKAAVDAAKATKRALEARELDTASLDAMPSAAGDAQWQCLAEAIYHESRGEPLPGQVAVAEVVLNRVNDRQFPNTVCGVTKQGAGSGRGCQFSYACDGRSDVMKSPLARERSEKLATLMLAGRARTVTDGATYFHTRAVRPAWAPRMTRTATIGHHIFYRAPSRVASN